MIDYAIYIIADKLSVRKLSSNGHRTERKYMYRYVYMDDHLRTLSYIIICPSILYGRSSLFIYYSYFWENKKIIELKLLTAVHVFL